MSENERAENNLFLERELDLKRELKLVIYRLPARSVKNITDPRGTLDEQSFIDDDERNRVFDVKDALEEEGFMPDYVAYSRNALLITRKDIEIMRTILSMKNFTNDVFYF